LFAAYGISIREAFRLRGAAGEGVIEQIDGVIDFQGRVYLVEVKWWNKPLGVNEIAPHMVRIFARSGANGIIISDSGFTEPAISQCREHLAQKTIVLSSLQEIVNVLYEESDLVVWLRKKINAAIIDKNPFLDTAPRSVA
jgi:restriction endonuclease Mrr